MMSEENKNLRFWLTESLKGKQAHKNFKDSLGNLPEEKANLRLKNLPYTIKELAEHVRLTQKDILDFCTNPEYKEPNWPDDYWPDTNLLPPKELKIILEDYGKDLEEFLKIIQNPKNDLYSPIPHGTGQNLLHEALLIIDHTSYHTGQIITIRRMLNEWKT